MNQASFACLDQPIQPWVDDQKKAFAERDIAVIECQEPDQEDHPEIALSPDAFRAFCHATDQRVVFLHMDPSDLAADIRQILVDEHEGAADLEAVATAFEAKHKALLARCRKACPTHWQAQLFVLHQGAFVSTGVVNRTYIDLFEALSAFIEIQQEGEQAATAQRIRAQSAAMREIEAELLRDPEFAAVRGRRKRYLYVQQRYPGRVPPDPEGRTIRPEPYADPIDANLVNLVDRVSDQLDLLRKRH